MSDQISIDQLKEKVKRFCEARDWDQYHNPKDLAIGIVTEASELLALFRFLTEEEASGLITEPSDKVKIEDELADVLFFLLRFAQRFNIDLADALTAKLAKNEHRYPVDKARGKKDKYTEL